MARNTALPSPPEPENTPPDNAAKTGSAQSAMAGRPPGAPAPRGTTGSPASAPRTAADTGSGPQSPAEIAPASPLIRWTSAAVAYGSVAAGSVFAILALVTTGDDDRKVVVSDGRWWSLAFAFGVVGAGLVLLHAIGRDKAYGIFRPLIGADHRFSTSLTQIGLWTVAIAIGVAFLLGRSMFESGVALDKVLSGDRWDEYLLLLGGPFGGAMLAKGIVSYKTSEGTLQKSEAPAASASQVVRNDNGSADLIDAQYLLFNLVALGYFVIQLVKTSTLPEIPAPLLALTGGTAATYVASKAAARNAPKITAVTPQSVAQGGQLRIFGANFDPADRNDADRRVTVALSGWTKTIYPDTSSDTEVIVTIPSGAPPGKQTVKVASTAGVETAERVIDVVPA